MAAPRARASLDSVRRTCSDRLRLFSAIDRLTVEYGDCTPEWISAAVDRMASEFPESHRFCTRTGSSRQLVAAAAEDRLGSDFGLRSVVDSDDGALIRWYVKNEVRFFRIRFVHFSRAKQKEYVIANRIIEAVIRRRDDVLGETDALYQVSWKYALILVRNRKASLVNGKVYMNDHHFHIAACFHYMNSLLDSIPLVRRTLPTIKLDVRIRDLFVQLADIARSTMNVPKISHENECSISVSSLKDLSSCFPPCMERMFLHMEQKHRLRYNGRLQFIPFLKDIGLPVEKCILYFQTHSSYIMTEEEFQRKRYYYFIRYLYGHEARRIPRKCSDCSTIQHNSSESVSDCHGCPFISTSNTRQLFSLPSYDDFSINEKESIISKVERVSPNVLCSKVLAMRLDDAVTRSHPPFISTPMQFFGLCKSKYVDDSSDMEED